jgi:hypothetical protein
VNCSQQPLGKSSPQLQYSQSAAGGGVCIAGDGGNA